MRASRILPLQTAPSEQLQLLEMASDPTPFATPVSAEKSSSVLCMHTAHKQSLVEASTTGG